MVEKIRGTVHRTYFASPKFSAGVLQTETGDSIRFRGPFCANEGELVTLVGRWKNDAKYGRQFAVDSLSYELPDNPEGMVQYLAKHPAFVGIGEATARKIVAHAASAENLDRLIRQDITELHRQLRIPRATLESLREAWIANNHWFDGIVGCAVAASMQGVVLQGSDTNAVTQRQRVSFAELQRSRRK